MNSSLRYSLTVISIVAYATSATAENAPKRVPAQIAQPTPLALQPEARQAAPPALNPAQWAERLIFSGDFRLRNENIKDAYKESRIRNRFMARLGVTGKVNDNVDATIRLATGNFGIDNVNGYNVTMGETSDKKPIWVDLAFVDWKPIPYLSVVTGKMPVPFISPARQQLIWDQDVTLEGGAVRYSRELGNIRYFANLGAFWIAEQYGATGSPADSLMTGGQIGTSYKFAPLTAALNVGYYSYRVKGAALDTSNGTTIGANTRGNTANPGTPATFAYNYDELNAGLELSTDRLPIPVMVFADYVKNTAIDENDMGELFGIRFGRVRDPGSLSFEYSWRKLEKDAAFGFFADSDFAGGGTDHEGHRFNLQYQAAPNILVGATWVEAFRAVTVTNQYYERAQLDFTFSF